MNAIDMQPSLERIVCLPVETRAEMPVRTWVSLAIALFPAILLGQAGRVAPNVLPASAVAALAASLDGSRAHPQNPWRDTAPLTQAGAVNAYVEIPRGDRQKFEFDIRANRLALDRVIPEDVGGYPVNYGFVPQTISYDGDPFDALLLGPSLAGGTMTSGVIVGLMSMEDEKGLDSKVVLSPAGADGRPRYALTAAERDRIGDYFSRYKRHEPGKFSKVHGWGSIEEGRAFVEMTHAFFGQCAKQPKAECRIKR